MKPSNILIDQAGRASITDFGIARVMKDTMTRVTGRQDTSGTLPYMSPQQLMGDPPSPSQDVYSFGALVYECLCGHPPFFQGQIEAQIRDRDAADLDDVCGANGPLAKQVMKSLSKSPDARPSSCLAVIRASVGATGKGAPAAAPRPRAKKAPPAVAPRKPIVEVSDKAKPPPIRARTVAAAPPPPPRAQPVATRPHAHTGAHVHHANQPKASGVPSLIFGIISLVFPILALITGPIAWFSGGRTLAAARRGAAESSAVGMAKAGRVCGCLGFLLALVVFAIVALSVAVAIYEAENQSYQPDYNSSPYNNNGW